MDEKYLEVMVHTQLIGRIQSQRGETGGKELHFRIFGANGINEGIPSISGVSDQD